MLAERQLLFAVLAFEYEMLNLVQLQVACRTWAEDKSKLLAELLVEWGWLTRKDLELVDGAVHRRLAKHHKDARDALDAVMVRPEVLAALKEVKDDEIQAVLLQTKTVEPRLLNGRYRMIDDFAYGGMGRIWLAEDTYIHRRIAFKELRPKLRRNKDNVERFFEEIQFTGQLEHPGIVPIYDMAFQEDGDGDGALFYTMKFVKGVNMEDAIIALHELPRDSRERHLEFTRLLWRFIAVCQAVGFAHGNNVMHRDLKPANVMLGDFGETQVLDWGLAKLFKLIDEQEAADHPERKTMSNWALGTLAGLPKTSRNARRQVIIDAHNESLVGAVMGTPQYMAPEQAQGWNDEINKRADIYSLGAILYRLLTNQHPVSGTVEEMLEKVKAGNISPPRVIDPSIPAPLEAICRKAMAKEQLERYRDALDLAADVERWLADEPVSIHPDSRRQRLRRWTKRNPKFVTSCAVGIAMTFLATFAWLATSLKLLNDLNDSYIALKESIRNERKAKLTAAETASKNVELTEKAAAARKNGKQSMYLADMDRAQTAWKEARVGEVVRLLERHKPAERLADGLEDLSGDDLRGFEWQYWNRLAHHYQMSLQGHTGRVRSVAFSSDGKWLASASYDRTVKVWNAVTGQETHTLKGHTNWVRSVAFSSDGKRLASASNDTLVKVWDVTSGEELKSLKGHLAEVTSVAFSPDGEWLASGSEDQTVKVWDVTSGEEMHQLTGHTGGVRSVAFSADENCLASASADGTVRVWDAISGQQKLVLKGHSGLVLSVAFSADGKRLVSASADDTVKLWDATNGLETHTLKGHTDDVHSVAFSADGKRLASASEDQTVKVWDATKGQETLTLKGHTDTVRSVAFSEDGRRLSSASDDQTVKVWYATNGQDGFTLKGHIVSVTSVVFSADGKRLASASDDQTVKLWDATNGQVTRTLTGHTGGVRSVAFSADGKHLASASSDQTVKLWDTTSGRETRTLTGHTGGVRSVAFSRDGKRLASASADKTVKLWDFISGKETQTLQGHTGGVRSVAFSPDGKFLASASEDQTVKLWDATTGQETLTLKGHNGAVHSVAFSQDGNWLASASWDQTVMLWDAMSGEMTRTLKGHAKEVESVAFSPDGKRLASASGDQTVKVWDTASGQETLTLNGHNSMVLGVAFSADGNRLASAGSDPSVKVWDARPWTPELRAEREALSLIHFLRDQGQRQSEWLAALSKDQTLSEPVRQRALQFAREWK